MWQEGMVQIQIKKYLHYRVKPQQNIHHQLYAYDPGHGVQGMVDNVMEI